MAEEDLRVLLEEVLADCGVRRRLTVAGVAYYANGRPFAAARGDSLYLRLIGRERDELQAEAAMSGTRTGAPDLLGLVELPNSIYCDPARMSSLVFRSFEQATGAANG